MSEWSLSRLLENLHREIQGKLEAARTSFGHPGAKGDASETVWLELLQRYLPKRYSAEAAFVVDSNGSFSEQIDVLVFDRQYSPFIFDFQGQKVVPAESVYAVFEAKQSINADMVAYAQKKVASVRRLHRTSRAIPHAGGTYAPKELIPILGGIVSFESEWSPELGSPLGKALAQDLDEGRLDLGCVAAHGYFVHDGGGVYRTTTDDKAATAFLFNLIAMLQVSGTVPMIDVLSYDRWLTD